MRLGFGSLTFRRAFGESEIEEWNTLREVVDNLELSPNPDIMRRGLTTTESFTTQYLYKAITFRGVRDLKMQEVWQSPSLMKMKHFLWQAMRDRIQSAEQFKKKGEGSEKCLLCGTLESTNHILFMCPMASFIWCICRDAFGWSVIPRDFSEFFLLINSLKHSQSRVFIALLVAVC